MKKIIMFLLIGAFSLNLIGCTTEKTVGEKNKLEDSVFVGDSITEGFKVYEVLEEKQVVAGAGSTAGFALESVDDIVKNSPKNIFIMLGSCDVLMPVDDPKALFRKDMKKLVKEIEKNLPESKIYIQSITPVTEKALKIEPRYKEIGEYNEILKEVAKELSIGYIDLTEAAKNHNNSYAEDGIHFKKEFYESWLKKIAETL